MVEFTVTTFDPTLVTPPSKFPVVIVWFPVFVALALLLTVI
jgi:hypothetical protein